MADLLCFDESGLIARLAKLPNEWRVAFAALCAERQLPNYVRFSTRSGLGNPGVLREALASIWDEALLGLCGQFAPYPGLPRQKCDVWIGKPYEWVIEIKMARLRGDNGKPDDTAIKDILSPYESDRSALADCTKLANAEFSCRKAIVIYGFDYPDRPLDPLIDALELLATRRVQMSQREVATFGPLVHPVHSAGRMFGWEVTPYRTALPSDQ